MIDPSRVQTLNDRPANRNGDFVLYWMQQSQRAVWNDALEYAIERANELDRPVVCCFALLDDFPEANERHYAFMLDGFPELERSLRARKIKFIVQHGPAPSVVPHLAKRAAMVICDRGYLRIQKRWRDEVADAIACELAQVEGDVVVPIEAATDHHEFAARTLRPKTRKLWDHYLSPRSSPAARAVKHSALHLQVDRAMDVSDPAKLLARLKLDRSVARSPIFTGGYSAAKKRLDSFLRRKLDNYKTGRNEPANAQSSTLSPYLHFGMISPVQVALAAKESKHGSAEDRASFLEELIIRRELSMNFIHFVPNYDTYEGALPDWAKKTLAKHRRDKRPILYTRRELESASTSDRWWNAAMREMTRDGFMHNYMRMYWGKKILEWSRTPEQAFQTILHLNNRYFLDGRDGNSFANVAWLFGTHDRPWGPERKIFGLVRYMNAAGLERKFDMEKYESKF